MVINKVKSAVTSLTSKATTSVVEDQVAAELAPTGDAAEPFGSRRAPSRWEVATADYEKMGADELFSAEGVMKANLDESIVESHREYLKDTEFLATTGASHAATRDDFMPAVQFHGLPRKAHYAHYGAESTARSAQSETPETVEDIRTHNSTGYYL